MKDYQLGVIESRFAVIIWENEPIHSSALAKKSEEELHWKKSTTYTVLKRLCDKGIFQNVKGTVTSLISRQEFYSLQSEKFIEETFDGSLPAFLAAFTSRKKLTPKEVAELRKMVEEYEDNVLHVAVRSYQFMFKQNAVEDSKLCDLLLEVDSIDEVSTFDLKNAYKIYEQGYVQMMELLEKNNN